ncbi:hypothetical protein BGW41_003762 [Actinomortierella wolfii]|nr:hypothetical protein BGW41_003762 [Actinomortierella wolfii]
MAPGNPVTQVPPPTLETIKDRKALKLYAESLEELHKFTKLDPSLPRTEKDRMCAGYPYDPLDPLLVQGRARAREILGVYNKTSQSSEKDLVDRQALLYLLTEGKIGENVWIEPPLNVDYGFNISLDDRAYMNFNCVILDCGPISIGKRVLMAPNVQLYSATHPVNPILRAKGVENALPIKIGDDVWIGGGSVICPGVSIGNGSTVGAGSVVTKDVPPYTVVAGNPARVIRVLDPEECQREVDEEYERQAQGRFWEKWVVKTSASLPLPEPSKK